MTRKKRQKPVGRRSQNRRETVTFKALDAFDERSHLAETRSEAKLFELLIGLRRCSAALDRWQHEFLSMTCDKALIRTDHVILNMIRLHDRPKTIVEIGRILNRDDTANVNYSIRKLQKLGLVEKTGRDNLRGVSYRVTATGRAMTEHYARLRKNFLITNLPDGEEWNAQIDVTVKTLARIQTMYDMATSYLVTHRTERENDSTKPSE